MRYITLTPSNRRKYNTSRWVILDDVKENRRSILKKGSSYHQVVVAELVYALGLGSSGLIHEGSSPFNDT